MAPRQIIAMGGGGFSMEPENPLLDASCLSFNAAGAFPALLRRIMRIPPWFVFSAIVGFGWWSCQPPRTAPGVLVAAEPIQTLASADAPALQMQGFSIRALASYDITARVLHKKRYYDDIGDLAPYDLAVGWGLMSDQALLDKLSISQGNRFFFWEYQNPPPAPPDQIISHAANMHIITATAGQKWQIFRLGAGHLVRLRGQLVEVNHPGRPPWCSSLSRTDTGKGACEILFLQQLDVLD